MRFERDWEEALDGTWEEQMVTELLLFFELFDDLGKIFLEASRVIVEEVAHRNSIVAPRVVAYNGSPKMEEVPGLFVAHNSKRT